MRRALTPLALVVALLSSATSATAQRHADPHELIRLQSVIQTAVEKVAPSIVRVETFGGTRRMLAGGDGPSDSAAQPRRRPGGNRPERPKDGEPDKDGDKKQGEPPAGPLVMPGFLQAQGATSGVVLSSDGWILISRFALNFDPTTILITLSDGRAFHAVRGGEDTSRGIALVKIEATDLPVPTFVTQDDVRVGQWAFALGRTFGQGEPSVHMGIVSATRRLFGRAVQIDAYTSPANYGGPVIDIYGRVVGLSVPLSPSGRDAGVDWYDSGIGFAASVGADLAPILEQLREGEVLHRGFLGIQFDPKDPGPGVLIVKVTDESPAKAAGIRKGDRITRLDDVEVRNAFHMQMLISSKMGGDPLDLVYTRSAKKDGADAPQPAESAKRITVFLAETPQREREERTKKDEAFSPPWHDDEPDPDDEKQR